MQAVERIGAVAARIWLRVHGILKVLNRREPLAVFHAHVLGHMALIAVSAR